MSTPRDVETILKDAAETLQTAEWGLADFLGNDPRRRMPGLRNLVTFGVATTQATQNLRGIDKDAFDNWYEPFRAQMRDDPLMRYFWKLRSQILKEGRLGSVGVEIHVEFDGSRHQEVMRNPPPGARMFFIGDMLGGSGWEVELPDGTTTKYYVELPGVISDFQLHFSDPPTVHRGQTLTDTSIQALARHYIEYLQALVVAARGHFSPSSVPLAEQRIPRPQKRPPPPPRRKRPKGNSGRRRK